MAAFSLLTVEHYFAANYPSGIFEGSFCDISAFFNCDSSAHSPISVLWGVPVGFFGLILGGLVALGAVFPSESFERTNKTLSLLNILGVLALLVYSVVFLGSLCLLCSGFYAFSLLSYLLFWRYGLERDGGLRRRWLSPSAKLLATAFVITVVGAWGVAEYHEARREAQSGGAAARAVEEFYSLEPVPWPVSSRRFGRLDRRIGSMTPRSGSSSTPTCSARIVASCRSSSPSSRRSSRAS